MIDRRTARDVDGEIDPGLSGLSDHTVVMTFHSALLSLLPYLETVRAHAYDPWDNVTEPLYRSMVHGTFAAKYGIQVRDATTHKYGFTKHCYRRIFHVECVPSEYPVGIWVDQVLRNFSAEDLSGRAIVFLSFVDSSGIDPTFRVADDPAPRDLPFARVDIADVETGLRFRSFDDVNLLVAPDAVNFEWVAEDFDPEEHKFHKSVYFDDIG